MAVLDARGVDLSIVPDLRSIPPQVRPGPTTLR